MVETESQPGAPSRGVVYVLAGMSLARVGAQRICPPLFHRHGKRLRPTQSDRGQPFGFHSASQCVLSLSRSQARWTRSGCVRTLSAGTPWDDCLWPSR